MGRQTWQGMRMRSTFICATSIKLTPEVCLDYGSLVLGLRERLCDLRSTSAQTRCPETTGALWSHEELNVCTGHEWEKLCDVFGFKSFCYYGWILILNFSSLWVFSSKHGDKMFLRAFISWLSDIIHVKMSGNNKPSTYLNFLSHLHFGWRVRRNHNFLLCFHPGISNLALFKRSELVAKWHKIK